MTLNAWWPRRAKSVHVTSNISLWHLQRETGNGRGPIQSIGWSCQALAPIIVPTTFFKILLWQRSAKPYFVLKVLESGGCNSIALRKKTKTLNALALTLNCIWLWRFSLGVWRMWNKPSLRSLSGALWAGVVVPVRVSSVGQLKLFNHLQRIIIISYLKPCNYVHIFSIG